MSQAVPFPIAATTLLVSVVTATGITWGLGSWYAEPAGGLLPVGHVVYAGMGVAIGLIFGSLLIVVSGATPRPHNQSLLPLAALPITGMLALAIYYFLQMSIMFVLVDLLTK